MKNAAAHENACLLIKFVSRERCYMILFFLTPTQNRMKNRRWKKLSSFFPLQLLILFPPILCPPEVIVTLAQYWQPQEYKNRIMKQFILKKYLWLTDDMACQLSKYLSTKNYTLKILENQWKFDVCPYEQNCIF